MLPLAFDAHLDLSFNALGFDRDQTLTIAQLRDREQLMTDHNRKLVTVSLPEMRKAGFAVCLATVLARGTDQTLPTACPRKTSLEHGSYAVAHAMARGQLAYYELLETQNQLRMIRDTKTLRDHWKQWQNADDAKQADLPVGYILSMEGADPITHPDEAIFWWNLGLRATSLAHYGPGHYAFGTGTDGPLSADGRALLKQFDQLGMILDMTHTNDTSWFQAYEQFQGSIFASHNNCRALVETANNRQFTDEQIRLIIERDGVIGIAADNIMLFPQYEMGKTDRKHISLSHMADHVEHICQIAGNRNHVAIGSDLDGGYSANQCPRDLDTIADLRKLAAILGERGFSQADIAAFMGENWMTFFSRSLPQG